VRGHRTAPSRSNCRSTPLVQSSCAKIAKVVQGFHGKGPPDHLVCRQPSRIIAMVSLPGFDSQPPGDTSASSAPDPRALSTRSLSRDEMGSRQDLFKHGDGRLDAGTTPCSSGPGQAMMQRIAAVGSFSTFALESTSCGLASRRKGLARAWLEPGRAAAGRNERPAGSRSATRLSTMGQRSVADPR